MAQCRFLRRNREFHLRIIAIENRLCAYRACRRLTQRIRFVPVSTAAADVALMKAKANVTMRVILKDMQTGRFYAGPATWVSNSRHALDFERGPRALAYCQSHREHRLQIIYAFDNTAMSFEMPLL